MSKIKPTSLVLSCLFCLFNFIVLTAQEEDSINTREKAEPSNKGFVFDFSVSNIKLIYQLDQSQFNNQELVHEENLKQGVQYTGSFMYSVSRNTFLGLRYSFMSGNKNTALLHFNNTLRMVNAQKRIHYIGPIINQRFQFIKNKLSCDIYYSIGFAKYIQKNTLPDYESSISANVFSDEFGIGILFQFAKHFSIGGVVGVNSGAYKKHTVTNPQGKTEFSFENDQRNSIYRGYYGLNFRIK